MNILHCFADTGAENPCLSRYGNVLRIGINATDNKWSDAIKADANDLPIRENARFDVGWFHPPCGFVSPMSDTGNGSREDWPNLIPLARKIAQRHCDYWIIENKPSEYINETVILDGHMFQLGIEYQRAFETNFPVDQPAKQSKLAETSPFFYTEKPGMWWASVKGTDMGFSNQHIAKNTIPSAYIDYIMRNLSVAMDTKERPDYSNYDMEMAAKRSRINNHTIASF